MGRKTWLLGILLTAACVRPEVAHPKPPALALPDAVTVKVADRVVTVPLDDYVAITALSEVSPVGETNDVVDRIFDLQTVIARSYAVRNRGRHQAEGFDLCSTTHCQLYEPARLRTSRFAAAARAAAMRTAGSVVTYGSHVADTLFHSDCGGRTTSADVVWGERVPYLIGLEDDVAPTAHRAWRLVAPRERLRTALNADTRSAVGRRLTGITIAARDPSGRATSLAVSGERSPTLRGEEFRAIVNRTFGVRAVQSTRFTIRPSGNDYLLEGSGFGHGVGLCQRGAIARVRRGDTLDAILRAYFPGTSVIRD